MLGSLLMMLCRIWVVLVWIWVWMDVLDIGIFLVVFGNCNGLCGSLGVLFW